MWYRAQKKVEAAAEYEIYTKTFTDKVGKVTVSKPNWAVGKPTMFAWTTNSLNERMVAVAAPHITNVGQLVGTTSSSAARSYPLTEGNSDSASCIGPETETEWSFWFTNNSVNRRGTVTFNAIVKVG